MNYQLTILINNKLDEKKRTDILDDVAKSVGDKAKKDLWGVRGLAYPIKHEEKAYYAHFDFESDPGLIPPLDRKLKLNEEIVRYLLIKVEEKKNTKSSKTTTRIIEKKAETKVEAVADEVTEEKAEEVEATEEVEAEVAVEEAKEKPKTAKKK